MSSRLWRFWRLSCSDRFTYVLVPLHPGFLGFLLRLVNGKPQVVSVYAFPVCVCVGVYAALNPHEAQDFVEYRAKQSK